VQWIRCYTLFIENAGGNNDTKCLYFPFRLDQAPLTWLESLEKYLIDKWDQLKEQFTSNIAGAMGCSGTRMDLAMVKQEQGETLRKYMWRFFDKRANVVNFSDKEVIDLFQEGLAEDLDSLFYLPLSPEVLDELLALQGILRSILYDPATSDSWSFNYVGLSHLLL
jgi:hypothetical protein